MDIAHPQINSPARGHGPGDVVDHAIPRLNGVAEAEVEQRHAKARCLVGHDALPRHAGIGIFAERCQRRRFVGSRPRHREERIDATGGKENELRPAVTPCRDRRRERVDSPSPFRRVGRAKLLPRHVDHEGGVRKPSDGLLVHQIAGHGGDAMPLERSFRLRIGEPGHGRHASAPATGGIEPPPHHPRECRPHLPASPEDDDITVESLKSLDNTERGAGEMLLKSLDVGKGFEHGERMGNYPTSSRRTVPDTSVRRKSRPA